MTDFLTTFQTQFQANFHFIRPLWFVAILPAIACLWALKHYKINQSGWQKIIPSHLAKHVLIGEDKSANLPLGLIFSIWCIIIVALAGPTWEKRPQPLYQAESGKVILFDLSLSMRAEDIKPNRLTMARFKAIEIARKITEGDLGLVGYAGDAFALSPLTPDNNNIVTLLPNISPEIMPVLGSDAEQGVRKSIELLENAGYVEGEIFWITDGIDNQSLSALNQLLVGKQYKLLILGVGTETGAPIKLTTGELLKDNLGNIVLPKLNQNLLQSLANKTKGYYQTIQPDNQDIETLIKHIQTSKEVKKQTDDQLAPFGDQWSESGTWLILLILPFAAYAFRRGLIYNIINVGIISSAFMLQPQPVHANILDTFWQTSDQQAQAALQNNKFDKAAQLANDQKLKAAAHFKKGDYEAALKTYQALENKDADSLYNKGNTLANLGQLDQAIEAYQQALQKRPNFIKAQQNKQLAEQLKQQQDQQQNQQQDQQGNSDQNADPNSSDQNSDQNNSDGQQGDQSKSDQTNGNNEPSQNQDGQQSNQSDNNSQPTEQDPQTSDKQSEAEQTEQQKQAQAQREKDRAAEKAAQAQSASESAASENEKTQNEQSEENAQAAQAGETLESPTNEQKEQAIQAKTLTEAERKAQEEQQVIQQLLNKVEDDPSYLLRRKMQLEYQKRRHSQPPAGVNQSW